MPPGAATIGCLRPNSGGIELVWILREESRRIRALGGRTITCRCNVVVRENVGVIPFLVCVGTPKPGNIWETWINVHKPGNEDWLEILSRQAERAIWFVGDSGTVEGSTRVPNDVATMKFARQMLARTKALAPWSQAQFERAREQIYRQCPDLLSLWNSLRTSPSHLGREGDSAADAVAAAADVLSAAEATLRNTYGQVQTVLNCLAPLAGAISFRNLAEYAQNCRCQPALGFMPLHLWDMAIDQARQRGLLRPHPADPEYVAVPADFIAVLRGRLTDYSTPPVREALDWAVHATYVRATTAWAARIAGGDPAERDAAVAATGMEYENLAAALDYGLQRRLPVIEIYQALNGYLHASHHFRRGVELGRMVLKRLETSSGEEFGCIRVLRDMALHQRQLGQFEDAELSCMTAMVIALGFACATAPGYEDCLAAIYTDLGVLHCAQRRWKRARGFFGKALKISTKTGNRAVAAENHREIARVAYRLGNLSRFRAHSKQAMELFAGLGNRLGQATICTDLALSAIERGRLREARKYYRLALALFVEFGDRKGEAQTRRNLGGLVYGVGKCQAAARHFRKAINIFFEIGDRSGRATTYIDLAAATVAEGDLRLAKKYFKRAVKLNTALGDRFAQGMTYRHLAQFAAARQQWRRARRCYDKALEFWEGSEDSIPLGMLHLDAGHLAYDQGQWDRGRQHIVRGLRPLYDAANPRMREGAIKRVAQIWCDSGDAELPTAIAAVLGTTPDEAEELLRKHL
jgi:tetratricopeptide (TPR) repeat protein